MHEIRTTTVFDDWLDGLSGDRALTKVLARIANMSEGNFGDCKPVGGGVVESRVHSGPGYRLYFTQQGSTVTVLLIGGDKSSQSRDILRAQAMAAVIHGTRRMQ
ncbi:type II toxin-antitoxin system RelE/ParE family toxin [Lysobacter sp. 2RAF19]